MTDTLDAKPRTRTPLTNAEIAAGERLRAAFNKFVSAQPNGFSQYKAAQQLGMTQPAVNQYLSGRVALNVKSTLRFADLLGVDPSSIYPEMDTFFQLARNSARVKKRAIFRKDGTVVIPKIEEELDWIAPVPSAKAIIMERTIAPDCPEGTVLVYDSARLLSTFNALSNPNGTYVLANVRGKRYPIYPVKVDMIAKTLVFIEDGTVVFDLTTANEQGRLPNGLELHPIIMKMCLTGL